MNLQFGEIWDGKETGQAIMVCTCEKTCKNGGRMGTCEYVEKMKEILGEVKGKENKNRELRLL